jgi:Cdc6-like AAA superfamily ATPase
MYTTIQKEHMKYPWKRFWCPRDGAMNLSDGGFLYDPDGKHAESIQPDVVPFEKISHQPCLALLGEPGIGKSTVMEELRDTVEASLRPSQNQFLYINLSEYGNESRLIQDLFGSSEFMEWKRGSHVLHLFLDSLDECKIQIPQVATLLGNRFRQVRDHLKRLIIIQDNTSCYTIISS